MEGRDKTPSDSGREASVPLSSLPPVEVDGVQLHIGALVDLCRRSMDAVMAVYRQPVEEWEVSLKNGVEPLTKADRDSDAILVEGLRAISPPSVPIQSEETRLLDPAVRNAARFVWLVDPLDGTKEFLSRNGQFAVNIGLCRETKPFLGIVGAPVSGDIFIGGKALGGAWVLRGRNSDDLETAPPAVLQPIRCKEFRWTDVGLKVVASSSHNTTETTEFLSRLEKPVLTHCGEWDSCAPHAVLQGAGGDIFEWKAEASTGEPGEPLRYCKDSVLNPFFVAVGALRGSKAPPLPREKTE